MKESLSGFRTCQDYIVGYHNPKSLHDEDWGVKKCGCMIHIYNWETCNYCSPAHYKTTNFSVQWRHYIDSERLKASVVNAPLIYNSDYYNRIFEIMVEENKDVNKRVEAPIDYDDCDSEIFKQACSFCDVLPMPGDEHFKRCGQCKIAKYCSAACQKHAWTKHKLTCSKPADLKGAEQPPQHIAH